MKKILKTSGTMIEGKSKHGQSCCPGPNKNTELIAFGIGVGATVMATLCCAGPLVAVVLGASGAIALAGLGKYHTYFMVAAMLILISGSIYILLNRQQSCATSSGKPRVWAALVGAFATFGLLTLGINQLLIPYLASIGSRDTSVTMPQSAYLHQTVLAIEGMTCQGCAGTIQTVLSRAPGVQMSEVSFRTKEAKLIYDARETNPDQLIAAFSKTQYKASLIVDELLK